MAARVIRESIRSFSKRCDDCGDLMKWVVARPLQDLGTPLAASVERAMPIAWNPVDNDLADNVVIAAEGVMFLGAFTTVLD
jgi:hypothetical protein